MHQIENKEIIKKYINVFDNEKKNKQNYVIKYEKFKITIT